MKREIKTGTALKRPNITIKLLRLVNKPVVLVMLDAINIKDITFISQINNTTSRPKKFSL